MSQTDPLFMNAQASFKEILEEKLTKTASAPRDESFVMNSDPAHLAFLIGQIRRVENTTPVGKYPVKKVLRPARKPHVFTEAQQASYMYFRLEIADFSEGYNEAELKKAFRQLALVLHPDQGGDAQKFMALKDHFRTLNQVLNK